MADSNNRLIGRLPDKPYAQLRALDRLAGTWEAVGSSFHGVVTFTWMEGEKSREPGVAVLGLTLS